MEEIPEDVKQKAAEIAIQLGGPYPNRIHGLYDQRTFDIVARALLAERERATRVAQERQKDWPFVESSPGAISDEILTP